MKKIQFQIISSLFILVFAAGVFAFDIGKNSRFAKIYSGEINKKSKNHYLLKMDNRQPKYWMWVKPGNLRLE